MAIDKKLYRHPTYDEAIYFLKNTMREGKIEMNNYLTSPENCVRSALSKKHGSMKMKFQLAPGLLAVHDSPLIRISKVLADDENGVCPDLAIDGRSFALGPSKNNSVTLHDVSGFELISLADDYDV